MLQPESVSRVNFEIQLSHTAQTLRRHTTSNRPVNMFPTGQPIVRIWFCPLCRNPFRRSQDRDRHLPLHLPFYISCSHDGCSWRGYRSDSFRKHCYRGHNSTSPDEKGYQLYDPGPLIKNIVLNPASIREAEIQAIESIKQKAVVLNKQDLWTDPWGHKGKSSRQYPRFSEMNALPITLPTPAFSSVQPTQHSAPVDPRDPYIEARNGVLFHHLTGSPLLVRQRPYGEPFS